MTAGSRSEILTGQLPAAAVTWVEAALTSMAADPAAIHESFPAAGRRCGRAALPAEGGAFPGWTVDEAVRALLLDRSPLPTPPLLATVRELYENGDAAERRGVLRALTLLDQRPDFGTGGIPIVTDAIRANDPRLIGAALGDYAASYLGDSEYRQAVLKCVFCGIPLAHVAGLRRRADAALLESLRNYVLEREAAGRDVPADLSSAIGDLQERTWARAIPTP